MTDDMMKVRSLVEKSADPDLLREMIGFAAERLMELEVGSATGAGDIITLSVPIAASEHLPAQKFADKVVLDQTNYYPAFGNDEVLDKC